VLRVADGAGGVFVAYDLLTVRGSDREPRGREGSGIEPRRGVCAA
jgi:hypothetical protein